MEERVRRGVTTNRTKRAPNSWTVVRLPERPLSEAILDLAAPLIEPLGPSPPPDDARRALELVIHCWNAHVEASPCWGSPAPKRLAALRKRICGKKTPPGRAETFEVLSERWRREFSLDPRLVGQWSYQTTASGHHDLECVTVLPDGVKVEVPPPSEKRIAIAGAFLDEVCIRQCASSFLSFPIGQHRGEVASDGVATIHTKMPTVVELFAEGRLSPVGGAPVSVMVGGRRLDGMVLAEVRCTGHGGQHDVAELIFRPA
jgi:hypothetical protein